MTLRLADAILLGDSLKKRDPHLFLSRDGSCGCALGGALLAKGINGEDFLKGVLGGSCAEFIAKQWPWLTVSCIHRIGQMYIQGASIEAIAAYADSIDPTPRIEPPVQEPTQVEAEAIHG